MCGIVGAITNKNVTPFLLDGLKRLEYRGYDSAGLAIINNHELQCVRSLGKVSALHDDVSSINIVGNIGIAHTRWATHGEPAKHNAHPHISNNNVAVVHNGIIENHQALKDEQIENGYTFLSETDSETIAHQIDKYLEQGNSLIDATFNSCNDIVGAYAIGIIHKKNPSVMIVACLGSPLVIGVSDDGNYIASDGTALLQYTNKFIYLEDGDIAEISIDNITIFDKNKNKVNRVLYISDLTIEATELGSFEHYMLKEIYEQPSAIANTLEGRLSNNSVLEASFGYNAKEIFDKVQTIQIVACGTSYHAGMVARNWFEGLAGIPCHVEVASEYRYRHPVVTPNTLLITISQSGETADTIAALRATKEKNIIGSLTICNVAESTLIRESDLSFLTRAGPEIGVASTKAFTTQLTALLMLVTVIGKRFNITNQLEKKIVKQLSSLPRYIENALQLNDDIYKLACKICAQNNALFLGRGVQYPVAIEGALKLKEISYIHAEAYPAGELKHGPLALVDEFMPIIVVAPNDDLLEKVKSNISEVRARKGQLIIFTDHDTKIKKGKNDYSVTVIPPAGDNVAPIQFSIPLQLLAYHVAYLKGTDIDQPRNLAKSVTVE
jgi:glutamine---fructose-6-phosphate transaminase (isomerizing)